jgi:hypothetical protein
MSNPTETLQDDLELRNHNSTALPTSLLESGRSHRNDMTDGPLEVPMEPKGLGKPVPNLGKTR